jgi:hypothetical protein
MLPVPVSVTFIGLAKIIVIYIGDRCGVSVVYKLL